MIAWDSGVREGRRIYVVDEVRILTSKLDQKHERTAIIKVTRLGQGNRNLRGQSCATHGSA